ncbi:MAG TPA: YihY family inner membrane protein [Stellaceae bacterium]|nr:YihY family inner membrane protein [Stellaceae bacterium]
MKTLSAFTAYCGRRFVQDGCFTGAGALSYTGLVALIPVTAIALAVLSAVPVFAEMRDQLLEALFQSFVPAVGAEVEWWFRYFAGTSVRTTTIGVFALAITVILLLAMIEDQLHRIWRVESPRPWIQRILAYWAIMTLGPLLLGLAFSLPSYAGLLARQTGLNATSLWDEPVMRGLVRFLPFVLEGLAFTLVYALIPNCSVRWREAAIGALVAAGLVEALKLGFGLYISHVSTYRAVYGALAAIPIFLLWMYVAWSVVLLGAVVAAALPQWRADQIAPDVTPAAHRLGVGLALLAELATQMWRGGSLSTAVLAEGLGVPASAIDDDLTMLRKAGFVAAVAEGGWVLARSLDGATLMELYRALGLPLATSLSEEADLPWQRRIAPAIRRIAAAEGAALAMRLGDLVATSTPVAPFPRPNRSRRP